LGKTIKYGEEIVLVSNEVAEFLGNDRKRQESESRSDRRHLSKSDFETVSVAANTVNRHYLENIVFKNLTLEKLQQVRTMLTAEENRLIDLYFYDELSMEQIGMFFGDISKMAISKRLKKLYAKMRSLMET
jgi:DNA-directed RNA polymerase specialized sigma subunit